jgi:hypothetical protein
MVWSWRPYEYWGGVKSERLDNRTIKATKQIREKSEDPDYVSRSFYIRLGTDGWRVVDDPKDVK